MSLLACKVVTLVLLVSTTLSAARSLQNPDLFGIHLTPKTHITISNVFSDGSKLTVRCKRGDNDLGEHVFGVGETYTIDFYPSLLLNTRYSCRFTSPHGWNEFNVYREVRDAKRCYKNCMWTAGEDAIKGYNMMGSTDIVVAWKH